MRTIESLMNRIDKLQKRDPVTNGNIIRKLKRRVRAMENGASV